jgi:preprotein translocase subunit SecD
VDAPEGAEFKLTATIKPEAARKVQEQALKQNITTLHNRINELGVAEPVIQQQGLDRIVVQLPGVQDTAKAKDILGRTATLEMRLVDESAEARAAEGGRGPGALRLRALPGAGWPAGHRQKAGHPDRRQPDRCPARLRRRPSSPRWT